jgi:RNA polymerase sigma-70 factor, ECF subfamily
VATRDMALTDVDCLVEKADERADAFSMDENAFRAFYDRTARGVWAYLSHITGDQSAADDLLQEVYYRFLRARVSFDDDAHRRNYLFRIATNLARDRKRRQDAGPRMVEVDADAHPAAPSDEDRIERQSAVRTTLRRMKRRDRELLWLAYAEGSTHDEIADALGLRARSVKVLLHRARQRFREVFRREHRWSDGGD